MNFNRHDAKVAKERFREIKVVKTGVDVLNDAAIGTATISAGRFLVSFPRRRESSSSRIQMDSRFRGSDRKSVLRRQRRRLNAGDTAESPMKSDRVALAVNSEISTNGENIPSFEDSFSRKRSYKEKIA